MSEYDRVSKYSRKLRTTIFQYLKSLKVPDSEKFIKDLNNIKLKLIHSTNKSNIEEYMKVINIHCSKLDPSIKNKIQIMLRE